MSSAASPAALLTGHGIAFTDSSLYGLVKRVYDFRMNAIIQQKAILLGGDITYLEGQDGDTLPSSVVPTGSGRGQGAVDSGSTGARRVSLAP